LITARDVDPHLARPAAVLPQAPAVAFRERILLMVLYVTVLASSVAFIEPSPHDGLMGVLLVVALIAGVRFERLLAVPLLLLLVWNIGGIASLLNVPAEEKAIQYTGTSVYLAVAALLFACLFANNTMARLATMRTAYVLTATLISLAGIAGYFSLFPHAHDLFATFDRALGAFKDPNVFGPYLIWPALIVIQRMLTRHIGVLDVAIVGILLFGLLLSFSRGAWFHFAVSVAVTVALTMLAAPTLRKRFRIFGLSAASVGALAVLLAVLLSFHSISGMFDQRAQLIQYYDVGSGGRFRLQELALAALLQFPNGMGPFEFARVHGLQQHNVYLQAFMVYGWVGGMAYILLLLSTLWIALRTVLKRTPWQPYLITAFAAFVGEVLEGFVIDTDHWRHFFLLLGMIWGLAAATLKQTRQSRAAMPYGGMAYAGAA
jgi:O-antigen ligase